MTTHIMVDLETWGLTPGSDIRSIGAVVFDPIAGTLGDEFYVNVENPVREDARPQFSDPADPNADRRYPLFRDPGTVTWWGDQSAEAQAAFANPVDLGEGLVEFVVWWAKQQGGLHNYAEYATFWAHGPHFDEAILSACFRATGFDGVPWNYRAPRDTRTIYEAAGGVDIPFQGTPHNALDDAKHQARCVIEAYRKLRLNTTLTLNVAGTEMVKELAAENVAMRNHLHWRVTGLLESNNREVERRRAGNILLREAAELFRIYEQDHMSKLSDHVVLPPTKAVETMEKAKRNATIAKKIEEFLR